MLFPTLAEPMHGPFLFLPIAPWSLIMIEEAHAGISEGGKLIPNVGRVFKYIKICFACPLGQDNR